MPRRLPGLLTVALLFFASPVAAQAPASQVRNQLDTARDALRDQGLRPSHSYRLDRLREEGEDTVSVGLTATRSYAIVGACDTDCADLDFWLYDENDNLIDSDTGTDAVPVVRVTPRWSGTFSLRVRMVACTVEPCAYGIGVFGD